MIDLDLGQPRRALTAELSELAGRPLGLAWLSWLGINEEPALSALASEAVRRLDTPDRRPEDAAILGLALSGADRVWDTICAAELAELACQGVFVPHRPLQIEADGDALLALAIGARTLQDCGQVEAARWLSGALLPRVVRELPAESWASAAAAAGLAVLGEPAPDGLADVVVALASQRLTVATPSLARAAAHQLRSGHPGRSALHAALRLTAARWLTARATATQTSLPEPTPLQALTDLLADRLKVDEQRDLVARLSHGPRLRPLLQEGPIAPRSFARSLVELLDAQGLIDDELFAVLCQMMPARTQEILALALRYPPAAA